MIIPNVINFFAGSFLLLNFIVLSTKIFPEYFVDVLSLFFSRGESLFILIKQADLVSLLAANFFLFAILIVIYFIFVFWIVTIVIFMSMNNKINHQKLKTVCSLIFSFMVLVGILTVYKTILFYSFTLQHSTVKFILALLCIIFLGILTFFYKKMYPIIYGHVEVLVGLSLVYIALQLNIDSTISVNDILRILVGIYVIVRGIDNVYQGSEKFRRIIEEKDTNSAD